MIVLGIHGNVHQVHENEDQFSLNHHDSSAAIVVDGEIIAAVEEERLTRYKHNTSFPENAIRYCLSEAGATLSDVDIVAFGDSEESWDREAKKEYLLDPRFNICTGKDLLYTAFEKSFGETPAFDKFRFCNHHLAHAASAFYCSGFDESLVVTIDGEGDQLSGTVYVGRGRDLSMIKEYGADKSPGYFYQQVIRALGYFIFDEYKVMGLAPYGDSERYRSLFDQLYNLKPDGEYEVSLFYELYGILGRHGWVTGARRKGTPFTQEHKDFAAGAQKVIEDIAFHILETYRIKTGQHNLSLAGGVAHNCTMTGKLLRQGKFKRIFVQPAAHDAGLALGAAQHFSAKEGGSNVKSRMTHVFYGPRPGKDSEIAAELEKWKDVIRWEKTASIEARAAEILADDQVIGWVQGRSEFGPRALGNRSILADPRPKENKARINAMVKKREGYRPFAPTVHWDHLREYFLVPEDYQDDFPFMNITLPVREDKRELLGAITHVDGTARVQTVSAQQNPRYAALLKEFEKRAGIPILLNTSFNNHAEPIVDSVLDAVTCFLTTKINYLIIEDYLISKLEVPETVYLNLYPSLPLQRHLVKKKIGNSKNEYYLMRSLARFLGGEVNTVISENMYNILRLSDGKTSFNELIDKTSCGNEENALLKEMLDLWDNRSVILAGAS